MPGMYQELYEDQVIATAGGTYATGGIKVTVTKCSQLLAGSLQTTCLGSGIVCTPVTGSEVGNSATMQAWLVSTAVASVAGTVSLVEMNNGNTSLIGKTVRLSYIGV